MNRGIPLPLVFQFAADTPSSPVPTVTISIAGGSFASAANTAVSVGGGAFRYTPSQAETETDSFAVRMTLDGVSQVLNVLTREQTLAANRATITTVTSQTVLILSGVAIPDTATGNVLAIVHDVSTGAIDARSAAWDESENTLTLNTAVGFTITTSDKVSLILLPAAAEVTLPIGVINSIASAANTAVEGGQVGTDAATAATEVAKIPRGASAITAGGNATRTKVSADGTTLVEAIT